MFTLEDREICKNCDYKEICAGECEKTIIPDPFIYIYIQLTARKLKKMNLLIM